MRPSDVSLDGAAVRDVFARFAFDGSEPTTPDDEFADKLAGDRRGSASNDVATSPACVTKLIAIRAHSIAMSANAGIGLGGQTWQHVFRRHYSLMSNRPTM